MCTLTRGASWVQLDRVGAPVAPSGTSPRSASTAVDGVVADARRPGRRPCGGAVPAVEVAEERLARRRADGLLRADDVPAERLVAVEELVVHALEVVAGRVVVHVHLLDDHALLALDLLGVELRVAEHVDEDVERHVAVLGRALHVVAGVLLAGEGVELAADRVDLAGDVARGRATLRSLEEHVLGEVRDPVRVLGLVARAGGQHHEAGDRLRLRHVGGQHAQAVRKTSSSGSRRRRAHVAAELFRLVGIDALAPVRRGPPSARSPCSRR